MEKRTITVTGHGQESLAPDQTVINITLEARDKDYSAVSVLQAEQIKELKDAVKEIGLKKDCLKTASFNIDVEEESYQTEKGVMKKRFKGYVCRQRLALRFDNDKDKSALNWSVRAITSCKKSAPQFLTMIKNENIRIISNVFGKMIISIPDTAQYVKEHLGTENHNNKAATVYVEDYVARLFLEILLNEEASYIRNEIDIVSVDGCEGITNRLSFDDSQYMSHKFIGVYDGDMQGKLDLKKIKWPHLFCRLMNALR